MSSQIIKRPIPYIALVLAHVIWGINFIVAKVTLDEFPPMSLAFLRFAFASLLLAPFFLAKAKKVKIENNDLPKLIGIGILIITLNITFFFEGIKRTSAIDASVLTLIIPMLSVLLGWKLLGERILFINLFGVGIGFLGALVIVGLPGLFTGTLLPQAATGNILIILAALSWVLGAALSKSLLGKYPSIIVTAVAFMVGTVTFFIPALIEYIKNPNWMSSVTVVGILGLIFMILLSSISAYFLFEWGLSKTSITIADLFQYIEPFVAAGLAVFILAETISTPFLIGGLLIAVGAYLGTLAKEAHHRHHKAHRV